MTDIDDIRKQIHDDCKAAVAESTKKFKNEIQKKVDTYYYEYTPDYYIRTGAFKGSLIAYDFGDMSAAVGFKAPSYNTTVTMNRPGEQPFTGAHPKWTGEGVLDSILNYGTHGGVTGDAGSVKVWKGNEEEEERFGNILERSLKKHLR